MGNVYSVSIISNDWTLKNPRKTNQTKLFFFFFPFWNRVAFQLYIQSWIWFVSKYVSLLCFSCSSSSSLVCFVSALLRVRVGFWGSGGSEQCTAASILPAEPVAALLWTEIYAVQDEGRKTGNDPLLTMIQTSLTKTWRGTNPPTFFRFGVGPGGFLTDQIVWTQRWDNTKRCIFELNAVTVQDCQKKTKKKL